jgi:hypothetical protein
MMSRFGWQHLCLRAAFLPVEEIKSRDHLENSFRIASSHIKADIDKLVKQEQYQISHWTQNISDVHELIFCKFCIMILLRNTN